ncbi:MAG TPA: DUF6338 family protein [Solirubrobacterales bacterium]|jgi:hypothetical protein
MPSTFEALAIFAGAVAPGYAFLAGYQVERNSTGPERDLYALAQAFILSAAWIAITWWPIGHLLAHWAMNDELESHELAVWAFACLLLGAPYILGRAMSAIVEAAELRASGPVFRVLDNLGTLEPPTLWDWTWREARERGAVVVVIRLKDGGTIEGQFASQSRADLSPRSPRVYLERAYGFDGAGKRVVYPRGAYVEGDQIVGVQFKS